MREAPVLRRSAVPHILVVDDEPGILRMVATLLSGVDCDVLTATGGRDAIGIIEQRSHELALVLTDVVMPDLDGVAVARACRAAAPPIPVLLMSGFTDANTQGLALIEKPFTAALLLDRVRAALDAPRKPPRLEQQPAEREEGRTG